MSANTEEVAMYPSVVRTVVPVIVGALIAAGARIGLDLPEAAVGEVVAAVVAAAYYAAARAVERHVSPRVGRLMLSGGLTRQEPEYRPARE